MPRTNRPHLLPAQRDRDDSAIHPEQRPIARTPPAAGSTPGPGRREPALCRRAPRRCPGDRGRADARPVDHRAADDDAGHHCARARQSRADAAERPDRAPGPTAPTTTTPATSPAAIELAITLSRNADKLAQANQQLTETQARLDKAQAELADTEKRLTDNTARLTELRGQLQGRAAVMYQRKGSEIGAVLNVDQIENVAASEQYVAAAAGFDNGQLEELKKLQKHARAGARASAIRRARRSPLRRTS